MSPVQIYAGGVSKSILNARVYPGIFLGILFYLNL